MRIARLFVGANLVSLTLVSLFACGSTELSIGSVSSDDGGDATPEASELLEAAPEGDTVESGVDAEDDVDSGACTLQFRDANDSGVDADPVDTLPFELTQCELCIRTRCCELANACFSPIATGRSACRTYSECRDACRHPLADAGIPAPDCDDRCADNVEAGAVAAEKVFESCVTGPCAATCEL